MLRCASAARSADTDVIDEDGTGDEALEGGGRSPASHVLEGACARCRGFLRGASPCSCETRPTGGGVGGSLGAFGAVRL